MELLTRQVDRVGVFRPLVHVPDGGGPGSDHVVELLRGRYRLDLPASELYGLTYDEAAALQAARGQDELVSALVDRFHQLERRCQAVLVLGTDFSETNIPDELAFNARLANEFGAGVLPVVGGRHEDPAAVVAEVRNAHRAYRDLGCSILAMVANRVRPGAKQQVQRTLGEKLPVPVYVIPEEPALAAPTVAQLVEATGATVLLGDAAGLSRDVRNFVFGGAMLPTFLDALTEGALVVTPGDRADLVVGALAAHAAGSPPISRRAADAGPAPGPERDGAGLPAGPGDAGGGGGRGLLADRGGAHPPGGPDRAEQPAEGRDRPRPVRTARGHRRVDQPDRAEPVRAGDPDDVRARAAGAGPRGPPATSSSRRAPRTGCCAPPRCCCAATSAT